MAINENIEWIEVEDLCLDPKNPRLGRHFTQTNPGEPEILEEMRGWALEELAVSFIESGFWPQEALIVVEEELRGKTELVVVEGNRRLAALKLLISAAEGEAESAKWSELAREGKDRIEELKEAPCVRADDRSDVRAYLGFRHVSGIKQWDPAEKAEFISHLIEQDGLTYRDVMRRIGSKTPVVRQNYIAYRILRQMEDESSSIDLEKVEARFSVLYLSLRTSGVQEYLGINLLAEPEEALRPVPSDRLGNLANYAKWLFGDQDSEPIVRDSRDVDKFGRILEDVNAVDYLERSERPSFSTAYRISGGDVEETVRHVERAADEAEQALGTAHRFKTDRALAEAVERLGQDSLQLLSLFPEVKRRVLEESSDA